MSYVKYFNHDKIIDLKKRSLLTSKFEVQQTLSKKNYTIEDLAILLSPAAVEFLEQIAEKSRNITIQRHGRVIAAYIPMYLSNVCNNNCIYCGFSTKHKYPRTTLNFEEIKAEYNMISAKGFRHILLLTGESATAASVDYLKKAVNLATKQFSSVGIEVYPMETTEYQEIIAAGADSLTIYQETYDKPLYLEYHPSGKKRDFEYRLDTPDRGGKAGFYKLNIGALLGLSDWRFDAIALGDHLYYLEKNYWQTKLGISMPRIQDIVGGYQPRFPVSDVDLVQFICAFRIIFPDIAITLSTRESANLRDNLIKLGITTISAESQTNPGGYSGNNSEQQFEISDARSLSEIKTILAAQGYEVAMKDWDRSFIFTN